MAKTDLIIASGGPLEGRRRFLREAGLISLAATAGLVAAKPGRAAEDAEKSSGVETDIRLINTALAAEYEEIAAYQAGADSGLLKKPVLDLVLKFQEHHRIHADALADAVGRKGGKPVQPKKPSEYGFQLNRKWVTQDDFLELAIMLERGVALIYLRRVPEFHDSRLSRAAAAMLGDEAMHWGLLRQMLGKEHISFTLV